MPLATQYSATPLRKPSSCQMLSSTCTAAMSVIRLASSICPTFTLQRPMCSIAPIALQRGERTHAGRERRSRVRGVKLIQMDPFHAEGAPAGLAGGEEVTRAAVRDPVSLRAGQAAFRGDQDARAIAAPCRERAGDEPFVVTDLVCTAAARLACQEGHAWCSMENAAPRPRSFVPFGGCEKGPCSHCDERRGKYGWKSCVRDSGFGIRDSGFGIRDSRLEV